MFLVLLNEGVVIKTWIMRPWWEAISETPVGCTTLFEAEAVRYQKMFRKLQPFLNVDGLQQKCHSCMVFSKNENTHLYTNWRQFVFSVIFPYMVLRFKDSYKWFLAMLVNIISSCCVRALRVRLPATQETAKLTSRHTSKNVCVGNAVATVKVLQFFLHFSIQFLRFPQINRNDRNTSHCFHL